MSIVFHATAYATYHNYDAEVGGPLKGSSRDTFKKARFYFTKTRSPRKLRTVSVLSQSSRLSLSQNNSPKPTTSPCSHHVATERVEEFTPFCAAASSNHSVSPLGALPLYRSDVGRSTSRRRTRYGHGHIGMDHVASRVPRSRLGPALFIWALEVSLKSTEFEYSRARDGNERSFRQSTSAKG